MASRRRSTRRTHTTARDYPRTARLNELLREILAEELERLDDERLDLLTVISVEVEPDLRRAIVFYDCLEGEAGDDEAMATLGEARVRLQAAIGRQARTKRVPELSFRPDPAIRSAARIDAILREMAPTGDVDDQGGPEARDDEAAPPDADDA